MALSISVISLIFWLSLCFASLGLSLLQINTNGHSLLGTLQAPHLPPFLIDERSPKKNPWIPANASNMLNPYNDIPDTGVIRSYDFTISRRYLSPDGYNKSVIVVNDQFPGPLIEANWGDTIQVNVINKIEAPEEGISLHWHGLTQKLTPWFDGIPSITQCPIAPGKSFTYKFRADAYGTSWYHSHFSAQYADGVFGPMVIYGPTQTPYDIDLGPILLTDYFHTSYREFVGVFFNKPPGFLPYDNNLINGKMDYNCSQVTDGTACSPHAGISKFRFTTGKVHRLRLINAGSESTQKFTIDNHVMTVIANDFVPVQPYNTSVITLGVGQRTDVLVTANGNPTDAVWMRSDLDSNCFPLAFWPHALAAIYYPNASHEIQPNTTATPWTSGSCGSDPLDQTIPYFPSHPSFSPAVTQTVDITAQLNDTGFLMYFMNNASYHADYNNPLLFLASHDKTSSSIQSQLYNFGNSSSICIIIRNYFYVAHPMHLHGHSFWVLAEGIGDWDGTVTRPLNPQRRDTHLMMPGSADVPSYAVIEFEADNPGVWPLHCHIQTHVSAGLYINILERADLITGREIPPSAAQTCQEWAQWSSTNVVDEFDTGL